MTIHSSGNRFSIGAFADLAGGLHVSPDDETGDYTYNPDIEDLIRARARKEAAVLIAAYEDRDTGEGRLVLTKRTESLRTHSGQIAFPGGRIDDEDGSPEEAAVRECEEETGVGARNLEVVGRLPIYLAGSGFRIHPVLARLHGDYEFVPNPDEVERIFDVPLSFLMDTSNHKKYSRYWDGVERNFYSMTYGENVIWGVTAGIIRVLQERLYK